MEKIVAKLVKNSAIREVLCIYLKFLFRYENLIFQAKNMKAEEGYSESNLTKPEWFAAEKSCLQ